MIIRFMSLAGLACLWSIAALAADKKEGAFRPPPASEFPNKQTQGKLIVAAKVYTDASDAKAPFGKVNPYAEGALPILLSIENQGGSAISAANLRVLYIDSQRRRIEDIPAKDLRYLRAPVKPKLGGGPPIIPGIGGKKKNPLAAEEIEGRAFAAKMIAPGDSAHGFFYFQAEHRPGAILYVSGLAEPQSGKELFFMEIPLD